MHATLRSRVSKFKSWWSAPATSRDRLLGALVGAFAGFWLGLLSLAALSPSSVQPLYLVCLVIAACVLAGVLFPKATTVVLFPFGVTGGGA
jgi:hypothetical protein